MILLLVTEGGDIFVEDFLQLFGLGVVVHHLTLDELRHLHLLFAVEGEGVWCTLLALLTTNDVVIAKELDDLLYLVLDGEARSLHVVHQE